MKNLFMIVAISMFPLGCGTAVHHPSSKIAVAASAPRPHDNCNIMGSRWHQGDCILASDTDRYTFVVNYPKGHTCEVKFSSDERGFHVLKDKIEFYLGFDFSGQGNEVKEKLPLLATHTTMLGGTGSEYYYMAFFTIKTLDGSGLNDTIAKAFGTSSIPVIRVSGVDCDER